MLKQRIDIRNKFELAVAGAKEKLEKKIKHWLERQTTKPRNREMHPGARGGKIG